VRLAGLQITGALPISRAGQVTSIVVLLFGATAPDRSSVVLWRDDPAAASGFAKVDSHYGDPSDEASAHDAAWWQGQDTPAARRPALRLRDDGGCALVLPCSAPDGRVWMLDIVASQAAPVARRIEIWSGRDGADSMARTIGWCSRDGALPAGDAGSRPASVPGPIDEAARSGVAWAGPVRGGDRESVYPFDHLVAIPMSSDDGTTDVVVLHF
jgi:hypothetical protein